MAKSFPSKPQPIRSRKIESLRRGRRPLFREVFKMNTRGNLRIGSAEAKLSDFRHASRDGVSSKPRAILRVSGELWMGLKRTQVF